MTDYTPDLIRSLSGRDLDRAVEELCYVNHPDIRRRGDPEDPRRWTTDANLTMCVFNPGGPLFADDEQPYWYASHWDSPLENGGVSVHRHHDDRSKDEFLASGSTIMEAVCRAACIVALESQTKGT